jgi:exopolysaccharide biosynthesis protein
MGVIMSFKKIFMMLVMLAFLLILGSSFNSVDDQVLNSNHHQPPVKSAIDVESNDSAVRVVWAEVADPQKIALYPNFGARESAAELFAKNQCRSLVNGGFYGKDGQPIGLFVSEGERRGEKIVDDFFDGFLIITKDGKARLLSALPVDLPHESVRIALQSGPWLIRNGRPQQTSVRGDKFARRIVVARTTKNTILFLVVFDPQNVFSGPKLTELPKILLKFGEESGISLKEALNLDGGSASAFYTDSLQIPERTYIGSFFCIKE